MGVFVRTTASLNINVSNPKINAIVGPIFNTGAQFWSFVNNLEISKQNTCHVRTHTNEDMPQCVQIRQAPIQTPTTEHSISHPEHDRSDQNDAATESKTQLKS